MGGAAGLMHRRLLKMAPTVTLVVLTHLFLPLAFILEMGRVPQNDRWAWVLAFYIAASYVAFIVVAGAWSWFGRLIRWALPAFLLVVAMTTFPGRLSTATVSALLSGESLASVAVGTLFMVLTLLALRGRILRAPARTVQFPLRGGVYIVAQGGSTSWLNIHGRSASQRYGLDILKLNRLGIRARGLYPASPDRYAIFGADVLSPCDGIVAAAQDGFSDLRPPERDSAHRAGNYVAIESDGAPIYLAHLMKGTVCVKVGERVVAGEKLGRVGNSGNTTEPHLHIHAEVGAYPGEFSGKPGIPLRFGGRFLVRNDRMRDCPE